MLFWLILLAILLLLAVLVLRALRFTPAKEEAPAPNTETFDEQKAIRDLQALIRCKTVSYRDKSLEDNAEFERFEALLPELFPHVCSQCAFTKIGPRALLFHWKGHSAEKPGVLMAHYDVVPADENLWSTLPSTPRSTMA